ncbi:hypothetical protein [Mesohalobacter halotolerans]|uniref:Alpha/beta hydrolase n=1 Tax=Mesohalobacter halotolerans TaxID=1883405 RepID=A0A4U5TTM2_9FLAO|nr:hypothetical protein [Mesohalobacter halotolerans]MBS3738210.1 hypothetical protein [Psychroflexus sp.]TKS57493.1 hypothetical protein FCN74_03490 [Mesohalobacter halotolerans]
MQKIHFLFILTIFIWSCDQNDVDNVDNNSTLNGTGAYQFQYNMTNTVKTLNVFYHIPDVDQTNLPVLVLFHGAGRNASDIRNAWIAEANAKLFIIVAPEFSDQNFPGGDQYNLGNVFIDGDNPSPQTLNPEQDWTFSIVDPLFEDFKSRAGNTSSNYNVFGFSAGAQFAHRLMSFKPDAKIDKIVASAAGWYTVPDNDEDFPYGFFNSPLEDISLSNLFSKTFTIQIGTLDNNPNAPALRRNPIVDQQGDNRFDRAFYMFNTSQTYAESLNLQFNWEIIETPGNGHNMEQSVPQATEILF